MKNCPKCQTENPDGQKFCSKCGGSLVSELAQFLVLNGLSEHLALFEKNDLFTIAELKILSETDISELQSQSGSKMPYGDQIRLKRALASLSESSASTREVVPAAEKSKLEQLKEEASRGDLSAMHGLGEIYSEGFEGVDEDLVEAASWYRKAAEKGHAASQFKYGEALYYGHGLSEDERESSKWLRLATRQGHADAKNNYNERLEEGRFAYLLDSSEQGNGESQYRLGSLFYNGEQGHPVDKEQAAAWFRKAAAQGIAAAQYTLGIMTLLGDGVRQEESEGKRLIQAAAAQAFREAVDFLAQLNATSNEAPPVAPAVTQTLTVPSQELINKVGNGYLMMLLYVVTCGTTSIVGVVMAYMNRGKVPEGYLKTHCRWQIRSFWFFLLWSTVGSISVALIEPGKLNEGAIVSLLAFFWYYYRAFRGKAALNEGKPIYKENPPKVSGLVIALIMVVLVGSGVLKAYKEDQKKKIHQSEVENYRRQVSEEREARQRQLQAQQQSENEARLAREKAEAEEKARQAQLSAERAEKEKQEALQRAQQAEQAASQAQRQSSSQPQSTPQHVYLGVNGTDGTAGVVNGSRTSVPGAYVQNVVPGSPAEISGIRRNDIIISVGGVPVNGFEAMRGQIMRYSEGDTVAVEVVHDGGMSQTYSVRLTSPDASRIVQQHYSPSPSQQSQQSQQQSTTSGGGAQQQLPDGFVDFFKQYINHHASNSPWDIAYDYADNSYNCYANGPASRAFIADDVQKMIKRWPVRSYNNVNVENINVISPDDVRMRFTFNYSYGGANNAKHAQGTSTVDLEVRNFSGKWQITSFSEQVSRR